MGNLDGRVCMITGAARGIGRGLALRLAEDGAAVCVADLNGDGAETVAEEVKDSGGAALGVQLDVTDRPSVATGIGQAVAKFGRLDVFFNNAGVSMPHHFMDVEEEDFERIMRINALGVLIGMQEAAAQFKRQESGGKIVNTASIAGKVGFGLFAAYCASKFAVVALTQAGAQDLAADGITVNAFSPGVVDTELWEQLDGQFMELGETDRPRQSLEEFSASIPLGRLSTPDDIVGLCSFLASADSDYITGQSISVDGGMLMN